MKNSPSPPSSSVFPGILLAALSFLSLTLPTWADDELPPQGLLARYVGVDGLEFTRIDPDCSFTWGGAAPHPFISPDQFRVEWTGTLIVRELEPVTFHAYLAGTAQVTIGGQSVLEVSSDAPGWQTGQSVSIPPGLHPIAIHYQKTAPSAQLGLYWSGKAFPLEPLPAHLLFHETDDDRVLSAEELQRGELLFDAHRCNRCHQPTGIADTQLSEAAPALWGVTEGLNPDWFIAKLRGTQPEFQHSLMPQFGLSEEEATAIAAYLTRMGSPFGLAKVPEAKPKGKEPLPSGAELLHGTGCLACHRVGTLGQSGPYGGGVLTNIGAKRSTEWIAMWLAQPDKMNPQHRMPIFKLTPTERTLLAQELSKLGATGNEVYGVAAHRTFTTAQVDQGRRLVKHLRCANCHKIPAVEIDLQTLSRLDEPVQDWFQSCLADEPNVATGRPVYPQADRAALRRYVESLTTHKSYDTGTDDQGLRSLARNNCLSCHQRDAAQGIVPVAGEVAQQVPAFQGLSEALIPPNLTAVGDRLRDEKLVEAVAGDQKEPRLPWLRVRMPKFRHEKSEHATLVNMLIHHDRIPADAPDQLTLDDVHVDDQTLLLGRRLVGVGGFTCIACHKIGDYEPRNVAFGTRGSDLMLMGGRLRPEYFLRWTRSPLRIVPGMEMPSYLRPAPGVLSENLNAQFSTLWAAVSHPDFEPPTNPTQVEQFLVVMPGEAPRIVRDVFALPKQSGQNAVARAFAVGFNNGHSLLFDVDRAQVVMWTYGDFARQRTEGKSWYWDMAGSVLSAQADRLGTLMIQTEKEEPVPLSPSSSGRFASLHSYHISAENDDFQDVTLKYTIHTVIKNQPRDLSVVEIWNGIQSEGSSGWARQITIEGLQEGETIFLARANSPPGPFASQLRSFSLPRDFTSLNNHTDAIAFERDESRHTLDVAYDCDLIAYEPIKIAAIDPAKVNNPALSPVVPVVNPLLKSPVTTAPGYVGHRLNIPLTAMPTALAFHEDHTLYFTSLKGHVYRARDTNGDGIEDHTEVFEEGLAAPFGILAQGDSVYVGHKPELIRLRDSDGDGRADQRDVIADGWGYSDNYHDWTTGPVRDAAGRFYMALGSDYAQSERSPDTSRWRGKVLRVNSDGTVDPVASALRYPVGVAIDPQGRLFVTDQQGHGNPFNELDRIVDGRSYGVPARLDPQDDPVTAAAIKIPHPWTRSVNGLTFLPAEHNSPFAGQGLGCEYNGRFLVRFSLQEVEGEVQGAVYPFTKPAWENDWDTFLGPMSCTVAPNGDILVGSIHDSGWLGGLNTGEIVRLQRSREPFPNGIREVRATSVPAAVKGDQALEIEFIHAVSESKAVDPAQYSIVGYTRVWQGAYATDDSGKYEPLIQSAQLSDDQRTVLLTFHDLKPGYVYEIRCRDVGKQSQETLFPDFCAYSLNRLP